MPELTRAPAHSAAASGAVRPQGLPGFAVSPPRQFPAVPQRLCGRDRELKALGQMLSGHDGTMPLAVVISGPAGIGKTALALRWLRRSGPFPGGQLYASFGDAAVESVDDVLGRWLRALGVPGEWIPPDGPRRAALWRSVSAERKLAVLIDDAPSSAAIGVLVPGPGPAVVAATARCGLTAAAAGGARLIRLKPLGPSVAVSLLEQVAGPRRIASGRDASRELAGLCGGVPLALRCAAGVLAISPERTVADVTGMLAAELSRVRAGSCGDAAVLAALSMSHAVLDPGAARACRLISLHPGPEFGSALAAAVLGLSRRDALTAIGGLRRARLLDQAGHDRYRFHDLVRGHARAQADAAEPEQARRAAAERIIGWHLRHAVRAGQLLRPGTPTTRHDGAGPPRGDREFGTAGQALDWLDRERPSLRAVVMLAARQDNPAAAWQLADALEPLWRYRGHYGEQLTVSRAGLAAARACADRGGQARMHEQIGVARYHLGQPGEAARSFARARALWQDLGDKRRWAWSVSWLGRVAAACGEHEAAITLHQLALSGSRENAGQAALTRIGLGQALTAAGRAGEAAGLLREAVRVLDGGTDPWGLAQARAALGRVVGSRPAEAALLLEAALDTMRQLAALPEQAQILQALAETASRAGDPGRARAYYQQAAGLLPARRPRQNRLTARHAARTGEPDPMASREDTGGIPVDVSRPGIARVYDSLLGGTDNFPADRAEAGRLRAACPRLPELARENRGFLARAVTWLARQGISQFLDIGCGLPAEWNTHDAARAVDTSCRVVYADSDPMVAGQCAVRLPAAGVKAIQADAADPAGIFCRLDGRLIRPGEPTGLVLGLVLNFFDAAAAEKIVAELTWWAGPGSYAVISVLSAGKQAGDALARQYTASPLYIYTPPQAAGFLAGLDLVPPGLAAARDWDPCAPAPRAGDQQQITVLAAAGRVSAMPREAR